MKNLLQSKIFIIKLPYLNTNPFLKNSEFEFKNFMFNIVLKNNFNEYINDDEIIKAEKFLFLNDTIRYLMTRIFIKKILSSELNLSYKLIEFYSGKYKKPFVNIDKFNKKIFFNISHSKEYLAIGISFINEIGIDIEYKDTLVDFESLKSQIFSDYEEQYFNKLLLFQDKVNYFYQVWSLKEAILKGIGVGLFFSPNLLSILNNKSLQPKILNLADCDQESNFSKWNNYIVNFNDNYALAFSQKEEIQDYETIFLDHSY
ncbi:4'-phosphopantetheinyl transferase superfamily protein [Pigmentibacter sp. JX0631]|uniref:4'-phosphopantetheinyl transferase family protein n=1 Tax=Pigmentibacter sp. JX0631 TaxID=2976982 RepID=UPI0024685282|nr:4'-phosphopantetheinyl transferase superfamily protein [Pigmentibacter sp. JX0631]WGL61216.1 4'-phosphopantetheinyl transferase superfamily protein [Pigmentibacter sp. JX0631]